MTEQEIIKRLESAGYTVESVYQITGNDSRFTCSNIDELHSILEQIELAQESASREIEKNG